MPKLFFSYFVVTWFLLGRPCVAEDKKAGTDRASDQSRQTNSSPSPTHVVIDPSLPNVNKTESQKDESATPEKPLPRFSRPEWVIVYVTVVYVFINYFMLAGIRRQTNLMEKQMAEASKSAATATALAKQSADAALLSAKALAHAERPWLIVHIEEIPGGTAAMTRFQIHMYNHGNSPAYMTSCSKLETVWLDDPDVDLPAIPLYAIQDWDTHLLLPRHKVPVGQQIDPWAEQAMGIAPKTPKTQLVMYGKIEYTDGVTDTVHQTAFCYRRKRDKFSDMGGHLALCGPSAYNKHT